MAPTGRQVAGRLWNPAALAGLEQEPAAAAAAQHTCEPQAWGGRPLRASRGGGRGPGLRLTPCSLAQSITHARARPVAAGASARRRPERRAASIGKEQRDERPRPALGGGGARTGGSRNITRDPSRSKVHGARVA